MQMLGNLAEIREVDLLVDLPNEVGRHLLDTQILQQRAWIRSKTARRARLAARLEREANQR